jgi:hypothetical protein
LLVSIFTDIEMFAAQTKPTTAQAIGIRMKIITGILAVSLLDSTLATSATLVSDGSAADTQAKINSAADGDTVQIPAGSFTWATGVSVAGKGIKLQGAGAGRVIGRSTSSVSIGTGTKTITTQSGLAIAVGDTLRVERTGSQMDPATGNPTGVRGYMIGTVTSYSGTLLTLNVTTTSGGGTHGLWVISTMAATTITFSVSGGNLFSLTEDTTHNVELAGVRCLWGSTGGGDVYMMTVNGVAGGKPVFVHDCYFEQDGGSSHANIVWHVNRGILWNCSFLSFPFSMAGTAVKIESGDASSWTTSSTMGANDSAGTRNFYIEDCDFNAFLNAMDMDNNARLVVRYSVFNNAGLTSHGADSSYYGVRHYEFYNDTFIFNNVGSESFNMNWLFFLRGGTGVFTDNALADISSSWWGDKGEFRLAVLNLRENWGPNPCYGAGIAGAQYPCPRQVGMGNVTGTAGNDSVTYRGDSEPLYIWNNTGNYSIGFGDGGGSCSSPDASSDYIQSGRDYFNGTAKPGYIKFTYPHPLRTSTVVAPLAPQIVASPSSVSVATNQTATFAVTAAGSSPLAYQWQKNSANIASATTATYSIASAQISDAANYRCLVANSVGSATSAVASLTVTIPTPVPASIVAGPQSQTVSVGQSALFNVTAAGTAPLTYQWQKNSANIAGATSSSYSISGATTNDAGGFRCIVANAYGSATSSVATLTVSATAPSGNVRYVEFTAGNDSNPGTITSPWKRCPGMVGWAGTATLSPGDTVYFDRSDTWSLAANPSGPGLELKAGVHYVGNVWNPSGGVGTRALLFAAGEHESGVVRIWEDHATYPTWLDGFEINANGQFANLVDINHAHWKTGLTKGIKRVENCVAYNNGGNASLGYYKYGIIVSDNSPDASGWVANVEILNTVIHDIARDGFCLYPGASGMISNVTIRGCEVYNTCKDPAYSEGHGILIKGNVRNSVVEYNYAHDVNSSAVFVNGPETGTGTGPTGCVVRYNVLQTADNNGVIRFYGTGNKSVDVYGNVILPNQVTGGLNFDGCSGTHAVRVYNNTFYKSFVNIGTPSSTGTIDFRNNVIWEQSFTPLQDPSQKITGHANNLFFRSGGGTLVSSGGTSYGSGTVTGYEATASGADPQFVDTTSLPNGFTGTFGVDLAPNRSGLSLSATSPAVGTADILSFPYNSSINSQARPASGWDRGAYQRGGTSTPTAPAAVGGVTVIVNTGQ